LWPASVVLFLVAFLSPLSPARAAVERFKFQSADNYLIVEFLNDNTAHFELSALGPGPAISVPLATTPQVFKTDYAGPSGPVNRSGVGGNTLETPIVKVAVNANLCVTVADKTKELELTTICPLNLGLTNFSQGSKGLVVAPGSMQHVYGLGEQFLAGTTNSDWTSRVRSPGDDFGNQMTSFEGGSTGNAQIPVMYAVGPNNANYVLFLDEPYKQTWNFTGSPWKVEMGPYPKGGDEVVIDQVRWYVIAGPDLPALRQAYMDLTGHPPVPPKKMFGLWVSQYGFNNWAEIDGKRNNLRDDKFPIDGFVLDLQWFGGVPASGAIPSRMGTLNWDTNKFPDPKGTLANYKKNDGIGIIAIEESYVDKGLPEHQDLTNRGFFVKQCKNGPNSTCNPALDCPSTACPPVFLSSNPWWGTGGMIDWTNASSADYWHDTKRQPNLIDNGVIGHWIDLGEPEQYNFVDWTVGVVPGRHGHADYHNLYNFKWAESIARGYARHNVAQRPFMMARSGAAGIQRFGVAVWSGDIGSGFVSLATDENAQMHMSFSGIDYFGSDIGGFHRHVSGDGLNDLYTQWFADAMMFDVPGRPHTEDLCNCRETAPDKVGDVTSNLANLRQRYELSPYLYSLAHRAYFAGEPFAPPLVYYYQNDMNVRRISDEKLLGRDILAAVVSSPGATQRDVYLPAGDWINYHTNERVHSTGQTLAAQPVYRDGIFRLPTFVRAGAILPKMFIDDKSMNIAGKRTDGSTHSELIVRAYASPVSSGFTLYEDDGETVAYQSGTVRTTPIFQRQSAGDSATVTIGAASGSYSGAPDSRDNVIELVAQDMQGMDVTLNGVHLPEETNRADFDAATKGWLNAGGNVILAKSGKMNVTDAKTFEFTLRPSFVLPSEKFICAQRYDLGPVRMRDRRGCSATGTRPLQ
jgi:alpha-glucosidase